MRGFGDGGVTEGDGEVFEGGLGVLVEDFVVFCSCVDCVGGVYVCEFLDGFEGGLGAFEVSDNAEDCSCGSGVGVVSEHDVE